METENKQIYGLGLKSRHRLTTSLKKGVQTLLKKVENRLSSPFNRGISLIAKRIPFKSVSTLLPHELKAIVSFLEKNLSPGKNFVIFSEGRSAYRIVRQLQESPIGDRLWAHYDTHHKEFDTFNRCVDWVGLDHSYASIDFILFLTCSHRYEEHVRTWKFEYNSPWKIVLPFYQSETFSLKEWENPTPTLLWVMQFSGTNRLRPTFNEFAQYYGRTPSKQFESHPFTPRYIANLKHSSIPDSNPIRAYLQQEKHLYSDPNKEELTQIMQLAATRLGFGSWVSIHEYIDFHKIKDIKDLQSVVLIRDPRDMIVSAFFRCNDPRYLPKEHPFSYLHSKASDILSEFDLERFKEEALLCLAEGGIFGMCPTYFMNWPSLKQLTQSFLAAKRSPNAYCIKFEDIRSKPHEAYQSLIQWLNWNPRLFLSKEQFEKAIHLGTFEYQTKGQIKEGAHQNFASFDSKTGRAIAARKGISGDWKNHFSKRVKEYVKDQIGQELIDLGYEKDMNW